MSRSKKVTYLKPWESPKKSASSFVRLDRNFMLDSEVQELGSSAYRLYTYMLLKAAGKREFTFQRSDYVEFMQPATYRKARDELIKHGFIKLIASNKNLRKPSKFEFCIKWNQE